nr:unnamed protein product [Digitaria exilis]
MDTATAGSSSPPITPRADDSPEPSLPGEKVYVAVGREVAESRATLLWAMHKFPRGAGAVSFVLLHVYSPPKFLPFLGARIAAAQVGEKELAAYKKMELQRANDSLDQYLHLCTQGKGLVDLISEHHVTVLVMGTAVDKNYTKKMKILKSRKARFIEQQADPLCKIWFICKGTLVYCREAVQPSHEEMQECRQSPGVTYYSVEKSTSLSEMWCVANTWLCKSTREPHIERTNSDPFHLTGKENVEESCESYDNFQYVLRELESARKEAYEEKCRREKAERELFEALQKAHASENSYFREMKQKNELEEKLAAIMEEIESLTVEILSRVRHPNLVTLIGACKDAQALVYEYMPNGSLDDRLACKDNSKPLSWHDLKASNILLDGNNVAKLSGFSDVMRDPLIAADGFTYEADAIREWLDSGHRTSPMTNLELPHRDLLPNHALRSAIQEWLQTNGD